MNRTTMNRRGYSTIELLAAIVIGGLLLSIAIPTFGAMKVSMNFRSGEQALQALLARARWSAVNSGRTETRILIEGNVVRIRAGTAADSPVVAEIDVTEYNMSISGANFPVRLDARGVRINDTPPSVTVTNSHISTTRTFTIDPVGKVSTS
jgi:prepilin-type N-terminal cleavage/methylation domain-containing protein